MDLKFKEVSEQEVTKLKEYLYDKFKNNKFVKKVLDKELVQGNIYQITKNQSKILYINLDRIDQDYTEGGFVTKEFMLKYNKTKGRYFKNSWIYANSIVLGDVHSVNCTINDSIVIGNFGIAYSSIYGSIIIDIEYFDPFHYQPSILYNIKDSYVRKSKIILYENYKCKCDIISSRISGCVIKCSKIKYCDILNSVIKESVIKKGIIDNSFVNDTQLDTQFRLFKNYIKSKFQVFSVSNIGSRGDITTFVLQKDGIQANTGCFHGTIEQLKNEVIDSHYEFSDVNPYYNQYMAAIEFALKMFKINANLF